MKKIILLACLCLYLCSSTLWAASFTIRNIQIEGLHRVSDETVYSYLPIKRGQTLRASQTAAIIRDLYKTGFFDRISLSRQGDTLIIHVVERATIGQLKISGNSVIPTDKLTNVMKSMDIAEGRVYNRAILDKIKQSLLNQYYQLGRYNARVDVTVRGLDRNRVLVKIDISEGLVAKVRKIKIIGHHAFKERTLIKQLVITTPGILTFFTQTDRYEQEKLETSLENLRNYYLDRGYIKFALKSAQVAISPDRKSVYLTIVIEEGIPYRVKGFAVEGDLIVPKEELISKIRVHPGDIFSRQIVLDSEKGMTDIYGNKGYVYANVNLRPDVDEATHEVFLTFEIKPGKRTYVRHILFSDNSKTNDEALRREIEQMEGAMISTKHLEQSKQRLSLLPYIKNVEMSVNPVPEHDDLVDVNYKVTEDNAAQATLSVGYSQADHVILGAGVNQKNFLGTGKTLGINFTRSHYQRYYGINYTDPYYTQDGISRTLSLSASSVDPGNANISNIYTTNEYNAAVIYGIPVGWQRGALNNLQLGYGYEDTLLHLTHAFSPAIDVQVNNFINQHGRHFQQLYLVAGFTHDSRDKAIFPTSGMLQSIGLNIYEPAAKHALSYYTVAFGSKWYYPLTAGFILTGRGDFAYGNGFQSVFDYPFFKNYFAGGPTGIGEVRGYEVNSLGPKDPRGNPFGGNLLVTGSVGLIFPNFIADSLRTSAFVDAGNVYNTYNNRPYGGKGSGSIRYSAGIAGDWLSPMGLISISLAKPLNLQKKRCTVPGQTPGTTTTISCGDVSDIFQFSLGANFG